MEVDWQHGCWLVVVKVMTEVVVPIDPALNINRVCFFVVVAKSVHTHTCISMRQRHAMQASGHGEHACVYACMHVWQTDLRRGSCRLCAFHTVVGYVSPRHSTRLLVSAGASAVGAPYHAPLAEVEAWLATHPDASHANVTPRYRVTAVAQACMNMFCGVAVHGLEFIRTVVRCTRAA